MNTVAKNINNLLSRIHSYSLSVLHNNVLVNEDHITLVTDERKSMEHRWNEFHGITKHLKKNCSSTTLSTSNPAWTVLESVLYFHGKGPAAGYLNHFYGGIWCIWRFHFLSYITSIMLSTKRINLPRERIIVPTSRTSTVLLLVWSNTMKASIIFLSSTVKGSVKCKQDSGS